ncbi:methyltransferase domain-containing protein [Pyxidicoccus fallax]|uniref:Class I SAM-dependent methyltransferase n=1 Tax=Pyxidicoccus fallax TaxID=394095 RepID=A0A848LJK0_9BACT|nr:methyltransferase domain-containing protein [Pyxidicoccus fallax]NMO17868.1 class I SAM-dependent methyltransferase [Pyxidicoccus fallax]NPC81156.1 methyltransferase domain-containing protein [Pyxidicoccus fallax]
MKFIDTRYLADGKLFNHGQPATLIHAEAPEDFEKLLSNILDSGYYDQAYYRTHSGMQDATRVTHFWFLSELVRELSPRSVLDLGCGRGDVISLLQHRGVEVAGVDFSEDIRASVWPNIRDAFFSGDLRERCRALAAQGRRFDTVCGFDIWEHLAPKALHEYIAAVLEVAAPDALCLFVIPAFGEDRVFGEQFPLEFEENRARFEAREPFEYLLAEHTSPAIPASGHLIWAHTEWWERQFERHGLRRLPDVERRLHEVFDPFFPHSVKAFYVLARDARAGRARAQALMTRPAQVTRARLFPRLLRDVREGHMSLKGNILPLVRQSAAGSLPPPVKQTYRQLRQWYRRRRE